MGRSPYRSESDPTDFASARAILDKGHTVHSRRSRKIGNNTYVEWRDHDTIAVRLHQTDVVTFHRDSLDDAPAGADPWRAPTAEPYKG